VRKARVHGWALIADLGGWRAVYNGGTHCWLEEGSSAWARKYGWGFVEDQDAFGKRMRALSEMG
jgi:hypothetical protein